MARVYLLEVMMQCAYDYKSLDRQKVSNENTFFGRQARIAQGLRRLTRNPISPKSRFDPRLAQRFCSARSYYHDYDTSSLGHCTEVNVIYRLITQLEKDNINYTLYSLHATFHSYKYRLQIGLVDNGTFLHDYT